MSGYFSQLLRQTGVRYDTPSPPDATGAESISAPSTMAAPLDSDLEVCRLEPVSPKEETHLPGEAQVGEQPPLGWERLPADPQPPDRVVMVDRATEQGKADHEDKPGYEGQVQATAFPASTGRSYEGPGPAAPTRPGSPSSTSSPDGLALVQAREVPAGPEQPVVPPLTLESDLGPGARRGAPPWERDELNEKPASGPRHQWHKAMEETRKWVAESSGVGEGAEGTGLGTGLEASRGSRTPDFRGGAPVPAPRHLERDQRLEPQTREFHLSIGTISLTIEKPPDIRPEFQPRPTRGDRPTGADAPKSRLTRHYLRIR